MYQENWSEHIVRVTFEVVSEGGALRAACRIAAVEVKSAILYQMRFSNYTYKILPIRDMSKVRVLALDLTTGVFKQVKKAGGRSDLQICGHLGSSTRKQKGHYG